MPRDLLLSHRFVLCVTSPDLDNPHEQQSRRMETRSLPGAVAAGAGVPRMHVGVHRTTPMHYGFDFKASIARVSLALSPRRPGRGHTMSF